MPIEDMIDNIAAQDFTAAQKEFDDIMTDKISAALDAEQIRLADQIFNDGEDEINDEEISDDDLEAAAEDELEDNFDDDDITDEEDESE